MKTLLIFTLFLVQQTYGVIYRLNRTEHHRMPPIFHLDSYEKCVHHPGGIYCNVDLEILPDPTSDLYKLIKEYSDEKRLHYNHSRLHHGICLTRTCKHYLTESAKDQRQILGECLNESMWSNYELQVNVTDTKCHQYRSEIDYNTYDILVAVVVGLIIVLNIVGSFYDFFIREDSKKTGNNFLMCFSIRSSWLKLVTPAASGPEVRFRRLKGLNGIRSITTMLIITGHSLLPCSVAPYNIQFTEEIYYNLLYHIVFNGTLVVQTFLILSGFLLSYNLLLKTEKKELKWTIVPRGIILRWLRLTPSYVVILAVIATWFRFLGSGPLWEIIVGEEVRDCQNYWFLNILYINNYFDEAHCMPETWYLAADMQAYIIALCVCVLISNNRIRQTVLCLLFLSGIVFPAAHTYFQDLDPVLVVSPETGMNLFVTDATFNNVYKRTHTNLASFVMGIWLSYVVYQYQKCDINIDRFKKYRFLYWMLVPLSLGLFMFGSVFYLLPPAPLVVRALYAGIVRVLFSFMLCTLILGLIFKLEHLYRGILEWGGWTSLSRVSYIAYLLHLSLIRIYVGSLTSLVHVSLYHIVILYIGVVCMTFILSLPYWLLIEMPLYQVVKLCIGQKRPEPSKENMELGANDNTKYYVIRQ